MRSDLSSGHYHRRTFLRLTTLRLMTLGIDDVALDLRRRRRAERVRGFTIGGFHP